MSRGLGHGLRRISAGTVLKCGQGSSLIILAAFGTRLGDLPVGTGSSLDRKMSRLDRLSGLKLGMGGSLMFLLEIEWPKREKTFIVS